MPAILLCSGSDCTARRRLKKAISAWTRFAAWTAVLGIHEFCSPTYYGTDINGLMMIQSYAQNVRQRKQADGLLRLFWTDIAANWFPAAQRLGGCQSRSYDYLRGIGALDWQLWINGWLESASPGSAERCEPWTDQWTPPPQLAEMARQKLPRLVRQHWGMLPAESRTQMIYPDVVLSCCGAAYGNQDSTLVVDLPGSPRFAAMLLYRRRPRGPLREEKVRERSCTPREGPAHAAVLGRAAIVRCGGDRRLSRPRRNEQGSDASTESFRRAATGEIWLDGKPLTMPTTAAAKPAEVPFAAGSSLVFRYGSAAVGLRVPWWTKMREQPATAKLVDDGNPWNCLRVTIDHGRPADISGPADDHVAAAAALWVRVGSELSTGEKFTAWCNAFDAAKLRSAIAGEKVFKISVNGNDGPLGVQFVAPFPWDAGQLHIEPGPYQGVLAVNGREVGRPLLTAVEPLSSLPADSGPLECIKVLPGKAAYWDAAAGLLLPGMRVYEDAAAAGHRYIAQEASPFGEPSGIALWSLQIEKPGRYWLWCARSVFRCRSRQV